MKLKKKYSEYWFAVKGKRGFIDLHVDPWVLKQVHKVINKRAKIVKVKVTEV